MCTDLGRITRHTCANVPFCSQHSSSSIHGSKRPSEQAHAPARLCSGGQHSVARFRLRPAQTDLYHGILMPCFLLVPRLQGGTAVPLCQPSTTMSTSRNDAAQRGHSKRKSDTSRSCPGRNRPHVPAQASMHGRSRVRHSRLCWTALAVRTQ